MDSFDLLALNPFAECGPVVFVPTRRTGTVYFGPASVSDECLLDFFGCTIVGTCEKKEGDK